MQHPIEFAEQKLGVMCWPKMAEIFEAVRDGERKVLVRSCNGAGKTTALAALCNWYLSTYKDSIVLTTASSWMQVKRNLWGEIRRQARMAKLYRDSNGNPLKLAETAVKLSDKHYMIGIAPDVPENAMGFHAPRMLIAVDEATGVSRDIMDALSGNLTGADAQIVMICNPIDMQSYPYEAEQSGEWRLITISAFEHPNVVSGKELIKGAVTREWIEDRLRSWSYEVEQEGGAIFVSWLNKWYRSNPILQARILGEWAQLEEAGFISMELIERNVRSREGIPRDQWGKLPTQMSDHSPQEGSPQIRTLGVDISRGVNGDATVYASFDVRDDGPDFQRLFKSFYDEDLMVTADRIREEYEECCAESIELVIAIDDTGLGGGVSDRLKQMNVPHFAVNFNHKPKGFLRGKTMSNARAEMYFLLHEELLQGKLLLQDFKRFHRELSSVRLDVAKNTTDAYKMEDKAITKRRLGHSPDYADATALARYALRLKKYEKNLKLL
jgi:phage terminase large subunit